ncbi:hypothetical protein HKX48_004175 [Thoreauomyces humboldtii]|nr:hypothetical protein HKX48_004175 [Thoreauomyces humboldtii]
MDRATNYDYIAMLNMPDLATGTAEVDFANDLDLWLNTPFTIDDPSSYSTDGRKALDDIALDAALSTPVAVDVPPPPQPTQPLQEVGVSPSDVALALLLSTPLPNGLPTPTLDDLSLPTLALPLPPDLVVAEHRPMASLPSSTAPPTKSADELEKRARNTAASARFRVKKKQRGEALERTAREMTERVELLERRLAEHRMELNWLRQLVTDRDGKRRLKDFYDESGLEFNDTIMAAGYGIEVPPSNATAMVLAGENSVLAPSVEEPPRKRQRLA